jgi:hypothetical protein
VSREITELGNRLAVYADTITAFAFVQSVTFSVALGSADGFAKNAVRIWWLVPLLIIGANLSYAYLVSECHRGERALLEPLASPGDDWEKKVKRWRIYVILLGVILSLFAFGASWYGVKR